MADAAKKAMDESSPVQTFVSSYRESQIVFEEGGVGGEMYLILAGKVRLVVGYGEAQERTLAVLNPGDFFGEMALVDSRPRSATAVASEENTLLAVLDRPRFLFMVQQQPQFALSVMHVLCQRLREMDKRLS